MRELNGGVEAEIEMYSGNLPQRRRGQEGKETQIPSQAKQEEKAHLGRGVTSGDVHKEPGYAITSSDEAFPRFFGV